MPQPSKPKVHITPAWLDAMIPPEWFNVASILAELAEQHKVEADKMRLYIRVGQGLGEQAGMPLVEAVAGILNGAIKIHVNEEPPSRLILPQGASKRIGPDA